MNKKEKRNYFVFGIVAVVLILVLVLVFSMDADTKNNKEEVIKIGSVLPLSGAGSLFGQSYVNGVELALSERNYYGDKEIEFFFEDGKFEGKESVDAANYLLNVRNVDILTTLFELPAKSISPISKETKTPLIYEAYTESLVEENPYVFKAHFNAVEGCRDMIDYAKNNNLYDNLGVLMAKTEYNELCLEGIKKINPSVKEYWYVYGQTDFKTLLAKMNEEEVDALATIMIDFEYLAMFKQLKEFGYPIRVFCATATECIFPELQEEVSNEFLEGTLGVDFIPVNVSKTDFGKKYLEKYPRASNMEINYAVLGYDMVSYVSKALENCNLSDVECVVTDLENVSEYKSVLGTSGFNERKLQQEQRVYIFEEGEWVSV